MKKISILVIITVLMASLGGCSGADKADTGKAAPSPSSSSAGKSAEPAAANKEPAAVAEPEEAAVPAAETSAPATTEDKKQQESVSSSKSQSSGSDTTAATQKKAATAKTTPKKAAEAPAETTKPAQTAKPPATETPAAKPVPAPEKPKTAYEKPYDTAKISADMAAYGASIGMTWCTELTKDNCSWEAPGITSSTLQGERLKAALQSSIRRIKKLQQDNGYNPGEFLFKVTFEPRGSGEYTIYFLMG